MHIDIKTKNNKQLTQKNLYRVVEAASMFNHDAILAVGALIGHGDVSCNAETEKYWLQVEFEAVERRQKIHVVEEALSLAPIHVNLFENPWATIITGVEMLSIKDMKAECLLGKFFDQNQNDKRKAIGYWKRSGALGHVESIRLLCEVYSDGQDGLSNNIFSNKTELEYWRIELLEAEETDAVIKSAHACADFLKYVHQQVSGKQIN